MLPRGESFQRYFIVEKLCIGERVAVLRLTKYCHADVCKVARISRRQIKVERNVVEARRIADDCQIADRCRVQDRRLCADEGGKWNSNLERMGSEGGTDRVLSHGYNRVGPKPSGLPSTIDSNE